MTTIDIDLFAGPGGWDVAADALGLEPHGIEWDEWACQTARAAGFTRHQNDIAQLDPWSFVEAQGGTHVRGLIGSPPCQSFSMAGKGRGRIAQELILSGVSRIAAGEEPFQVIKEIDDALDDRTAALVLEPLRWALDLEPEWIALEQVPPVLPLWNAMADVLHRDGYSVDTGLLTSEQYDTPQTRKRAFLIASKGGSVSLPAPLRRKYRKGVGQHEGDPDLAPWISMAQALHWDVQTPVELRGGNQDHSARRPVSTPASTLHWSRRVNVVTWEPTDQQVLVSPQSVAGGPRAERGEDEPSVTVTTGFGGRARWELRSNYGTGGDASKRGVRDEAEPAPTVTTHINRNLWQARNAGPQAQREPRSADDPSYTIRAQGSGSHPSGVEWRMAQAGATSQMVDPRPSDAPAGTITAKATAAWVAERPSTTVQGDPRIGRPGHKHRGPDCCKANGEQGVGESMFAKDSVRVTIDEAATLQGFPVGYPWQGTKTAQYRQIGDAVPPPLAWHVLRAAMRLEPQPWPGA